VWWGGGGGGYSHVKVYLIFFTITLNFSLFSTPLQLNNSLPFPASTAWLITLIAFLACYEFPLNLLSRPTGTVKFGAWAVLGREQSSNPTTHFISHTETT
jgi:hypothetical protein